MTSGPSPCGARDDCPIALCSSKSKKREGLSRRWVKKKNNYRGTSAEASTAERFSEYRHFAKEDGRGGMGTDQIGFLISTRID